MKHIAPTYPFPGRSVAFGSQSIVRICDPAVQYRFTHRQIGCLFLHLRAPAAGVLGDQVIGPGHSTDYTLLPQIMPGRIQQECMAVWVSFLPWNERRGNRSGDARLGRWIGEHHLRPRLEQQPALPVFFPANTKNYVEGTSAFASELKAGLGDVTEDDRIEDLVQVGRARGRGFAYPSDALNIRDLLFDEAD